MKLNSINSRGEIIAERAADVTKLGFWKRIPGDYVPGDSASLPESRVLQHLDKNRGLRPFTGKGADTPSMDFLTRNM